MWPLQCEKATIATGQRDVEWLRPGEGYRGLRPSVPGEDAQGKLRVSLAFSFKFRLRPSPTTLLCRCYYAPIRRLLHDSNEDTMVVKELEESQCAAGEA